ncbi:hypothetical protein [Azospirillum melinis]
MRVWQSAFAPPGAELSPRSADLALVFGSAGIASADDSRRAGETLGEASTARPGLSGVLLYARGVSYGEIGPMRDLVDCRLHNQTMTVALLTER